MPDKHPAIPRPQRLTEGALSALERFSHIEAVSGIVLLLAATSMVVLWLGFATVRGLRDGSLLAPEPVAAITPVSA